MGCFVSKSRHEIPETNRYAKQNIRNFYKVGKLIGYGNFGNVRIGYLLSSMNDPEEKRKKFAIKSINKVSSMYLGL